MAEKRPIRHQIDFQIIPALYHANEKEFALTFAYAPEEFLAGIYSNAYKQFKPKYFWQKPQQYSKTDFCGMKREYPNGIRMIYVTVPPAADGSQSYCTAFALAQKDEDTWFFTIEKRISGACSIGTVDENGNHIKLEDAGASIEENLHILYSLNENKNEEPSVETKETVYPDGSRVVTIIDHRTGRGEIREYDVQGNLQEAHIGSFGPKPEYPPEDPEELIAYFMKKEEEVTPKPPKRSVRKSVEWKPKNIMDEVRMMVRSCSSPPLVGTPEENARRVMGRIEYFREQGVSEKELYELEGKILQFMPDFVVDNFAEFYQFLKEDISSIYITMELLMARGNYAAAKKIADPLAIYLEQNKSELIDGRHCHQNAFETALYTLEEQKVIPTPSTKDNYTAFLVAYARILQNTRIIRNQSETFQMEESRKYLKWALGMSPQNASVWLYLGFSYIDDESQALKCYRKALDYCYTTGGAYGLITIYDALAMHYLNQKNIDVANALRDIIDVLSGDTTILSDLLEEFPVNAGKPYHQVLQDYGISVGFSDLIKTVAIFLEDPRADTADDQTVRKICDDIDAITILVS